MPASGRCVRAEQKRIVLLLLWLLLRCGGGAWVLLSERKTPRGVLDLRRFECSTEVRMLDLLRMCSIRTGSPACT